MKETILTIALIIGLIITPMLTFMWYHEQAHAQICKLANGTPKIKISLPTSTTTCINYTDEQTYKKYNSIIEIVGYHLYPIETTLSLILFLLAYTTLIVQKR